MTTCHNAQCAGRLKTVSMWWGNYRALRQCWSAAFQQEGKAGKRQDMNILLIKFTTHPHCCFSSVDE